MGKRPEKMKTKVGGNLPEECSRQREDPVEDSVRKTVFNSDRRTGPGQQTALYIASANICDDYMNEKECEFS